MSQISKIACEHDRSGLCVIIPTDQTGSYCLVNCNTRANDLAFKVKKPMTVKPYVRKELRLNGKCSRTYNKMMRQEKRLLSLKKNC